MSKQKQTKKKKTTIVENIIRTPLEEVMHQSMIPYAQYVILERALPRVEDGLKPVQRRILYSMWDMRMTPDKPYKKCARIVGECLGKYHPHGDTSVYDALVRMAQPFSMRGQLVDGHGNFGSIDGDTAAAMRYTEAKLAPLSMKLIENIEKDTVPFVLNFDDSLKEPSVLPARYPNLLVNGSSGIAVGLATNIPPHNLTEVAMGVIAQIDNPDISVEELMQLIPAPDFPTGGILIDNEEILKAYKTGRGRLTLRAKVDIEKQKSGKSILVIREIPFQVSKANMLEKILNISESRKNIFGSISDIRDESDRDGMRAVIELKKEADPEQILAYLYKYSDLQVTFGVNMVAIAEGKPVQMGLKEIIGHFINHQRNVITRRTTFDLEQNLSRLHILEGLIIAVDDLDEAISLIRNSQNPKEANKKLMERYELTSTQAQAILDMRLQRLTNLEIISLKKEHREVRRRISELKSILKSEKKLLDVIKKEIEEVADEFPQERLTEIEDKDEAIAIPLKDIKVIEETTIIYTHGGYLRRIQPRNFDRWYKNYSEEEYELEEDFNIENYPKYIFHNNTEHQLLFFTDYGNCYTYPVNEIIESSRPREQGDLLTAILADFEKNEKVVKIFSFRNKDFAKLPPFIFYTNDGTVKKTSAEEYSVKRQKFIAIKLRKNSRVINVELENSDEKNIMMVTRKSQAIRFESSSISLTGRATIGVAGMQVEKQDDIIWASQIHDEDQLLMFSERGSGKRILAFDFENQRRNGKGNKSFYFNKNKSNGSYIAGLVKLEKASNILILQENSSPTIISSNEVRIQNKKDRGRPYVLALLDDVITEIIHL